LDPFWTKHIPASRQGPDWVKVLTGSVAYRLTRHTPPEMTVARWLPRLGKTLPGQPLPKLISLRNWSCQGGFVVKAFAMSARKTPANPGSVKKWFHFRKSG
jgi:hypothetical protein